MKRYKPEEIEDINGVEYVSDMVESAEGEWLHMQDVAAALNTLRSEVREDVLRALGLTEGLS